ncbi:MAG: FliA/WhiG family RNA polymerase sigma factor [Nitrospinales bacterium]
MIVSETVIQDTDICSENLERIVYQYSSMVKYAASRIAMRLPAQVEMDDLVSVGMLGLMDAIKKFDPNRGAKFKTYAEFRVRGAILDELRSMDWAPRSVRQKASKLEAAVQKLQAKFGRYPEVEEVAKEMKISLSVYFDILNEIQNLPILSLEDIGVDRESGEKKNLLDCLAGKGEDPQAQLRLSEVKGALIKTIEGLPEREGMVLTLYYYKEMTMKEIGEALGITESRVSQVHSKAVIKLRTKLKALIA